MVTFLVVNLGLWWFETNTGIWLVGSRPLSLSCSLHIGPPSKHVCLRNFVLPPFFIFIFLKKKKKKKIKREREREQRVQRTLDGITGPQTICQPRVSSNFHNYSLLTLTRSWIISCHINSRVLDFGARRFEHILKFENVNQHIQMVNYVKIQIARLIDQRLQLTKGLCTSLGLNNNNT